MLFKKEFVAAVLRGDKRQTVRLKRPRVHPGRTYAVQTSYYSPALGRIRVTGVRRCTLAGLTERDLALEGWSGRRRKEFERYFAAINHLEPESMTAADWKRLRARPIWCIDFDPANDAGTA